MDLATIIGLVVGIFLVLGAILIGGSGFAVFLNAPSLMIVVGGAFSALLVGFPLAKVLGLFSVIKKCFLVKLQDPQDEIRRLVELATTARRDGLLALENQLPEIEDDFLRRGLEMVITGIPKETLQKTLEIEINCVQERHTSGKKILDALGAYAPAFGMVGTLIGLVQMLQQLDDPSQIGVGMATALLTTLYGALLANLVCIPLGSKLDQRSKEELLLRELIVSGLVALVEGQAPRAAEEKLKAYLTPKVRQAETAQAA